jgi:hypothetical protein
VVVVVVVSLPVFMIVRVGFAVMGMAHGSRVPWAVRSRM